MADPVPVPDPGLGAGIGCWDLGSGAETERGIRDLAAKPERGAGIRWWNRPTASDLGPKVIQGLGSTARRIRNTVPKPTEDLGSTAGTGQKFGIYHWDRIYDFLKGADVCFAPQRPEILKKLQADGTKTVYDVHWEEGQTLEDHKAVLRYADVFTPNDKEAMFLTNTDTPEDALRVLCEYTKQPIVKIGKKGCCTMIDGEIQYFPAREATPVDKTGAGDNFLAGLVFGMYRKLPVGECIRLANIAGALSTEAHGCFSAKYDLNDYLR